MGMPELRNFIRSDGIPVPSPSLKPEEPKMIDDENIY